MKGIEVRSVEISGIGEGFGIQPGDRILSINGNDIKDPIDYRYHEEGPTLKILIENKDQGIRHINISKGEGVRIGLELAPIEIKRCRNRCIFCFMDQMPKGLRRSLYIKDDDFRLSFLFGNYITLTNLTEEEKERIAKQRLSPLYISVHTTDTSLRRRILGNQKAPDIMEEIRRLAEYKIMMHTQIVIIPNINDGKYLKKSIRDLSSFYPYISSIAVVPVGLTGYRDRLTPIPPFTREKAEELIDIVRSFQIRFRKDIGPNLVFAADEFYIKGERLFPRIEDYEDLPQIENGVGMVPYFIDRFKELSSKIRIKVKKRGIGIITGVDFSRYLKILIKDIAPNLRIIPVSNFFFGKEVTVTGLLTGSDIRKKIKELKGIKTLLVPSVVINDDGLFLDDMHIDELKASGNLVVNIVEPSPEALIKELVA